MKPKGVHIITEDAQKEVTFLMDVDPLFVSLVKHGANQQPFRVIKEDTGPEDDEVYTIFAEIIEKGGPGSGNIGHEGRPGEVGGSASGEGGGTPKEKPSGSSDRAQRAKDSYKPATREVQQAGLKNQTVLATSVKGMETPDNAPFDMIVGNHFVEIKTIVRGKNDKITMHPESLQRKVDAMKKEKGIAHTVVFDNRVNKIFYKEGLGSFRLKNMQEISLKELKGVFK